MFQFVQISLSEINKINILKNFETKTWSIYQVNY